MVVATFAQVWEAVLARGLLENEGITAVVDAAAGSNPYPSLVAAGSAEVRLLVPRDRADQARAVLRDVASET